MNRLHSSGRRGESLRPGVQHLLQPKPAPPVPAAGKDFTIAPDQHQIGRSRARQRIDRRQGAQAAWGDGGPGHRGLAHIAAHVRFGGIQAHVDHFGIGAGVAQGFMDIAQGWGEGVAGSAPVGTEVQGDDVGFLFPLIGDQAGALGAEQGGGNGGIQGVFGSSG